MQLVSLRAGQHAGGAIDGATAQGDGVYGVGVAANVQYAAADGDLARVGKHIARTQRQSACADGGGSGVGIDTAQGNHARAGFVGTLAARQNGAGAAALQVVGGAAGQCAAAADSATALQRHRSHRVRVNAQGQGAVSAHRHVTHIRQHIAGPQGQCASAHGGATAVAVAGFGKR